MIDLKSMNQRSRYITPLGQSDQLFSNNFDDLFGNWKSGKSLPIDSSGFVFLKEQILLPYNYTAHGE